MSSLKNFLHTEVVDVMRGFILPCPQVAWLHSISGIVVVVMQLNVLKVMDSVVKPISVSMCGLFNPSSEVPDFVAKIFILIVIYVSWCKKALVFWPQKPLFNVKEAWVHTCIYRAYSPDRNNCFYINMGSIYYCFLKVVLHF